MQVVVNIGRWPLGTLRGSTGGNPGNLPWSVSRYAAQLSGLLAWLAALREASSVPVAFMATNAMPLHAAQRQTHCPPGYTEYPHVVHAFNEAARRVSREHGVPFLDTFAVSRDVLELSFDGAHFGDPVALGLAVAVEAWLEAALSSHSS